VAGTELDGVALSAKTAMGLRIRPIAPARTKAAQATRGGLREAVITGDPELTLLPKSLQVLRPGRMPGSPIDPKTPASAGPFVPGLYSPAAQPASPPGQDRLELTLPYFHIFVTPSPLPPFRVVRPGTCAGQRCAILPENQLGLSRGK
jgi:hypothetical protein